MFIKNTMPNTENFADNSSVSVLVGTKKLVLLYRRITKSTIKNTGRKYELRRMRNMLKPRRPSLVSCMLLLSRRQRHQQRCRRRPLRNRPSRMPCKSGAPRISRRQQIDVTIPIKKKQKKKQTLTPFIFNFTISLGGFSVQY